MTAVADAEALTGHAGDEGLAAGGTVKGHVAGDDVFLVEVLNLQIIESLRPLLAGKVLDVLFDDGLVLLIDPQVH